MKTHEYGYIRDGKIYLNAFLDLPERQIGVVKESEEDSIKYFEKRFEIASKKVETLENLIEEAQNKGSYLMKLIHMRKYLANFDGLGDYEVLFVKLDKLEENLRVLISQNRERNLQVKSAFLEEAESLLYADDLVKATDQIKDLKERWIKTGAVVEEQQEAIEAKFEELYAHFFEQRKTITKQRSKEARARQKHYKEILQKAEDFKDSDEFEETFQIFRSLQQKWKEGGKIPHRKATAFWEKFKDLNDAFFSRYKSFKTHYKPLHPDALAIDVRNHYEEDLAKEAESLVNLVDVDTERAKELLMEWKKLSTTFRNIDSDYFRRFRRACDTVFEVSYLVRVVTRKYPDINEKPLEDQLRIKVSFMRELIRRDENEIKVTESNLQRMERVRVMGRRNMQKRNLENTLNTQKRKMWVKKEVLTTLEEELEAALG